MAASVSASRQLRQLQISAGSIPLSQLQQQDAIYYALEPYKGFRVVEQMDPQAAWTLVRAMAPDTQGIRGPIGEASPEAWHNNWPDKLAIVVSNDHVARKVWAAGRYDDRYLLIVREYA